MALGCCRFQRHRVRYECMPDTMPGAFRQDASERAVALDRHATAGADPGVIVPQRHVLNTAIVPERDRVGPPAKPHLEFRPGAVLEQIVQDGAALLFGKPVDMGGKSLIDEQRLAPALLHLAPFAVDEKVPAPSLLLAGI